MYSNTNSNQKYRKIFQFKWFKDSEEFESWQRANLHFEIVSIQPAMNELKFNVNVSIDDATPSWGCIVTYVVDYILLPV